MRIGKKVRQTIVEYVGLSSHPETIDHLVQLAETIKLRLEHERSKPLFGHKQYTQAVIDKGRDEDFADVGIKELQESGRYSSGIMDVFGKLYDDLGFGELFKGQHAMRYNHILKACVVARLANPSSKLKTTRQLEKNLMCICTKYLNFDEDTKIARVDGGKIVADTAWDGISGYITNSKRSAGKVIASYRRL